MNYMNVQTKVEFKTCNWCGKIYRIKKSWLTGMVTNRKYCSESCLRNSEGKSKKSVGLKAVFDLI